MQKPSQISQDQSKIQCKNPNAFNDSAKKGDSTLFVNSERNTSPFKGYKTPSPCIATHDSHSYGVSRGIFSTGAKDTNHRDSFDTQNSITYRNTMNFNDQSYDKLSTLPANLQEIIGLEVKMQIAQLTQAMNQTAKTNNEKLLRNKDAIEMLEETMKQHISSCVDMSHKIEHIQTDLCHLTDGFQVEIDALKKDLKTEFFSDNSKTNTNLKDTLSRLSEQIESNNRLYTDNKCKTLENYTRDFNLQMNKVKEDWNKNINLALNDIARRISDDNEAKLKEIAQELLTLWEKKLNTVIGYMNDRITNIEKNTHNQHHGEIMTPTMLEASILDNTQKLIDNKITELNNKLHEQAIITFKNLIDEKLSESSMQTLMKQYNKRVDEQFKSLKTEYDPCIKDVAIVKNDMITLRSKFDTNFADLTSSIFKLSKEIQNLLDVQKTTISAANTNNSISHEVNNRHYNLDKSNLDSIIANQTNLQQELINIKHEVEILKSNSYTSYFTKSLLSDDINQANMKMLYDINLDKVGEIGPSLSGGGDLGKAKEGAIRNEMYVDIFQNQVVGSRNDNEGDEKLKELLDQQAFNKPITKKPNELSPNTPILHENYYMITPEDSSLTSSIKNPNNFKTKTEELRFTFGKVNNHPPITSTNTNPTTTTTTTNTINTTGTNIHDSMNLNNNIKINEDKLPLPTEPFESSNKGYNHVNDYAFHKNSYESQTKKTINGNNDLNQQVKPLNTMAIIDPKHDHSHPEFIESQTFLVNSEIYKKLNLLPSDMANSLSHHVIPPHDTKYNNNIDIKGNTTNTNIKNHQSTVISSNGIDGTSQSKKDIDGEEQELSLVYQLDDSGYLMDEDGNYIIDETGNKVKLTEEQLDHLRATNILEE